LKKKLEQAEFTVNNYFRSKG